MAVKGEVFFKNHEGTELEGPEKINQVWFITLQILFIFPMKKKKIKFRDQEN